MRASFLLLPSALLLAATAAQAQAPGGGSGAGVFTSSGGALQLVMPEASSSSSAAASSAGSAPAATVTWIDAAKLADQFRIAEPIADLRAVVTDQAGKNVGFYYASGKGKKLAVYRNGRLMVTEKLETLADLQKPVLFRMTASGDLVFALHGTDLYANAVPVSLDATSFNRADAANEHGGVLTYQEGGKVIAYDMKRDAKTVLHKHDGVIEHLRREGATVAYVLREKGIPRMYRDGRRVSLKKVENPANFAVTAEGDVYFFTKAARGYALYRNSRSFVSGRGNGAMVAVDPEGTPWHASYAQRNHETDVRLQKGRSAEDLLPAGTANLELAPLFLDGGYAIRAAFADDPSEFFLVRDGEELGEGFPFAYPYNDTNGLLEWDGSVVLRAYRNARWRAYADGEELTHKTLKNVLYLRANGRELTVYAVK